MFNLFSYVWYFFARFLVQVSYFQGKSPLKIVQQYTDVCFVPFPVIPLTLLAF